MKDLVMELNMIPGLYFQQYEDMIWCSKYGNTLDDPDIFFKNMDAAKLYYTYLKDLCESKGYRFVYHTFSNEIFIYKNGSVNANFMKGGD